MPKSRIFLIFLMSFLIGVALAKIVSMPGWVFVSTWFLLASVMMLFDDRPIKIVSLWAMALVAGIFYPHFLGRQTLVAFGPSSPLILFFSAARERFLAGINQILQEPYSAFAQGLTIGAKSNLSPELKQAFLTTGTFHLVAVSGYNLTTILKIFSKIFERFNKKIVFAVGTSVIFVFVFLTGGQAPVVRAAIMGWLFFLAPFLGRLPHMLNALFLAAVIMILFEPGILTESLSFQLSVLSMLGLILIDPRLNKFFNRAKFYRLAPKVFRDGARAAVAAEIATLGLVLGVFGRLSLIAPVANMLIAPFVPLATIASMIAGVFGMIWVPLGVLAAYPAWVFLKFTIVIIDWFANAPFASVRLAPWPWWWVAGYYVILLVVLWLSDEKNKNLGF